VFIIGMPPSPLFFSELYIALGLLASGNYFVLALWFILLASIVYGLGKASLEICMGYSEEKTRLPFSQYLPQAMLLLLAVAVPIAVLLLRP
jgi:formate hydrogenlyase subunit 3/multisubunit Na+/H+ antiporter MnhD subunit